MTALPRAGCGPRRRRGLSAGAERAEGGGGEGGTRRSWGFSEKYLPCHSRARDGMRSGRVWRAVVVPRQDKKNWGLIHVYEQPGAVKLVCERGICFLSLSRV